LLLIALVFRLKLNGKKIVEAKFKIHRAAKFRFGLFWGLMIVELVPESIDNLSSG
jgi:hypothetical protein